MGYPNHDSRDIVTSVNAQGTASADYDRATFSLIATKQAKTAASAKAAVEQVVAKIRKAIETFEKAGLQIDRGTLRANYSSTPHYTYVKEKARIVGYQTSYSLAFTSPSLDMVSDVQDQLTELKDVIVNDVEFGIKDTEALKLQALEDAHGRATARFEAECKVLGKDPDNYEIVSWNVHYNDGAGRIVRHFANSVIAAAAESAPSEMAIESGKADVHVTLSVSYAELL